MSKNNYKCLINSSAPRCVIIITINTGINHSYTISSPGLNTSHHTNTPTLSLELQLNRESSPAICCSAQNVGNMVWRLLQTVPRYQGVISWVISHNHSIFYSILFSSFPPQRCGLWRILVKHKFIHEIFDP